MIQCTSFTPHFVIHAWIQEEFYHRLTNPNWMLFSWKRKKNLSLELFCIFSDGAIYRFFLQWAWYTLSIGYNAYKSTSCSMLAWFHISRPRVSHVSDIRQRCPSSLTSCRNSSIKGMPSLAVLKKFPLFFSFLVPKCALNCAGCSSLQICWWGCRFTRNQFLQGTNNSLTMLLVRIVLSEVAILMSWGWVATHNSFHFWIRGAVLGLWGGGWHSWKPPRTEISSSKGCYLLLGSHCIPVHFLNI